MMYADLVRRFSLVAISLCLIFATVAPVGAANPVFGTVQVNGPVWTSSGAADWSELSATRPLVAGDKFRTGDEGYLLADMGEHGVVGMYGNTEITAAAAGAGALIDVLKGKVAFHLAPDSELQLKAADAEINANTAKLGRAADGFVEVGADGKAVLAVEEGAVYVQIAGVDRKITQGQRVDIGSENIQLAGSEAEDAAARAADESDNDDRGAGLLGGTISLGGLSVPTGVGAMASIAVVAGAVAIVAENSDDSGSP